MTSWHSNIWKGKIWLSQERKELSKWIKTSFLVSCLLCFRQNKLAKMKRTKSLKEQLEGLLQVAIHFIYVHSRRNTRWKQFLYDELAMFKQLRNPTYLLPLSCANLIWEKLPYIINKLNNLGLSDETLKNLNYRDRCNLSNNNPVLVARHFQYSIIVFLTEVSWAKENMLYTMIFKKG